MQTRDNNKKQVEEENIRDLELENITGSLLRAEYQVDKLTFDTNKRKVRCAYI